MIYDFDKITPRRGTDSIKWDYVSENGRLVPQQTRATPIAGRERLPLWLADMDFPAPKEVLSVLRERVDHGVFGYTQPSEELYNAIIRWHRRRKGWQVERKWILTAPKVMMTINLLVQALTAPGDRILVQTPVFHPIPLAVENNGRTLVRNRLQIADGRYQMDFEDLAAKAAHPRTKMLILCSPHNPVGRVWSRDELVQVGEICLENEVIIVVDEIHSDLVYSWADFTTFGALGTRFHRNLVLCEGPSKTFNLPGLQISYAIIPHEELRSALLKALRNLDQLFGVSTFGALALHAAYEHGGGWLSQVMAYIERNYLYLSKTLGEKAPQVRVVRPEAMYLVWLDCRALGLQPAEIHRLFYEEAGVYLENGAKYGEEGAGFMRINIACARTILEEALARIIDVLEK